MFGFPVLTYYAPGQEMKEHGTTNMTRERKTFDSDKLIGSFLKLLRERPARPGLSPADPSLSANNYFIDINARRSDISYCNVGQLSRFG